MYSGTKEFSGAGSHTSSLLDTSRASSLLASGLIKPGLDTLSPMLAEVAIRQNVVVFHSIGSKGWMR
jgi:hypothetical protein